MHAPYGFQQDDQEIPIQYVDRISENMDCALTDTKYAIGPKDDKEPKRISRLL